MLRNFRRRRGELDLVVEHDGALAIIEVRMRRSGAFGGAAASVGSQKQRRLVIAAQQLLQSRPDLARWPVRFDVIALRPTTVRDRGTAPSAPYDIEWIRHAFSASG